MIQMYHRHSHGHRDEHRTRGAALEVPGLRALAELIHDLDLKDQKFGRPETAGLGAQLTGLTLVHDDDPSRVAHGLALFDQLLQYFATTK